MGRIGVVIAILLANYTEQRFTINDLQSQDQADHFGRYMTQSVRVIFRSERSKGLSYSLCAIRQRDRYADTDPTHERRLSVAHLRIRRIGGLAAMITDDSGHRGPVSE